MVIINDILDYSKIEADKIVLHEDEFDLERAVHDVAMLLKPTAREKGLSLLVDYDMFLPTRFIGDAGRIRQVLTNLMGNAVKFTVEGHVLVRVVGIAQSDGRTAIHLTVEDTGIGIPADKIDHVFGEFNQVEDDRNRKFEGTGLGLAITRRLVEMMEGEVWVDSEIDKGSSFGLRILLPVAKPETYETAELPEGLKHVLLADDHNMTRSVLAKQLEGIGLKTSYCKTGAEVLEAMKNAPDLIIAEQDLPDMCGSELVAQLRETGNSQPVLLLSDNPSRIKELRDLDVHSVLQKPVARRALFEVLSGLDPDKLNRPAPASGTMIFVHNRSQRSEPPVAPDPQKRLNVLLAEDNKTNQLVFRKMVSGFDIDLRFANDGIEAVQAYRDNHPDVIFMDISMPQMDGKQATREIRQIEGDGPHVPIIAVTAHAMSGDRETILEAGLDDYLTKPLRKAELSAKLQSIIDAARTDQAS